ncbi:hypothetical protein DCCM_2013 [Desulfocucumis palustris]|uniref:Guanylate cyclase domain-containing protein n=1 Tax=Desulfocucumis palustris TaxID=1898651 RepID=A0A2L2XF94_9FIRM|nr:adenylate/guanylate cyclase domain-containing protein [Desulfocucumis palustris]GBF32916.1 hypothetical protein DCCM_2013 [Desulfocucumis palustris]
MSSNIYSQYKKMGDLEAVCIAFFDLVDSTALKRQLGQSEGITIAVNHNKLAGDICERYKGRIVKYIGDAVMAVFHTPLEAMLASLEFIKTIQDQELAFRTKVGFNHGMATRFENNGVDYYGQAVDRTARLNSQARPNQVLTDETTLDMLKPFLGDFKEIIFRFLGVRNLKGIGNVPIYELALINIGFAEDVETVSEIHLDSSDPVQAKQKLEIQPVEKINLPPLALPLPYRHLVKDEALAGMLGNCTLVEADINSIAVAFQNLHHIFENAHDLNIRQISISGSMARGTMIKPFKEIDVIAVKAVAASPLPAIGDILQQMERFLAQWNPGSKIEIVRNRVIVALQGVRFSIMPVLAVLDGNRGHLLVPIGNLWISRNPAAPEKWMEQAVERNGPEFLPFLRIIKVWQRTHANIVNSLHLEMFTNLIFGQASFDLSFESVHRWFRYAYTYFSQNDKPFIKDPTQPKSHIDEYLYANSSLFNIFGRALTNSYDLARQGIAHHNAGQKNIAMTKWKALFGNHIDEI